MRSLLITGGRSRPNAAKLAEGTRYERAVLVRLDLDSGEVETLLTRAPNAEAYPPDPASILFSSCARDGSELFLCSNTELLVYRWPELELLRQVSHPAFNEIHSVTASADELLLTSTGLDLVIRLDRATLEPLEFLHVLGEDPKSRFDWEREDCRKIRSTKPHASHPNYAFWLQGSVWATRFRQRDAVRLPGLDERIDIGIESPHDGHVVGDHVYFTTVDGHVIVADGTTHEVARAIDLRKVEGTAEALGWCRGLLVDGSTLYVGFSTLRETGIRENVRWLRGLVTGAGSRTVRITAYDASKSRMLREYPLPDGEIDAVFGILPADD